MLMGLGVPVAVPEANSSAVFGFISTSSNPAGVRTRSRRPQNAIWKSVAGGSNLLRSGSVTRPLSHRITHPILDYDCTGIGAAALENCARPPLCYDGVLLQARKRSPRAVTLLLSADHDGEPPQTARLRFPSADRRMLCRCAGPS